LSAFGSLCLPSVDAFWEPTKTNVYEWSETIRGKKKVLLPDRIHLLKEGMVRQLHKGRRLPLC
jgi:hypothetical protein